MTDTKPANANMIDTKPANANIDQLFVQHLRRSTRPDGKQGQLTEKEPQKNRQERLWAEESQLPEKRRRPRCTQSQEPEHQYERHGSPKRQLADPTDVGAPEVPEGPQSKKLESPEFHSSVSPASKPIRSRARAIPPQYVYFEAVPREPGRKLWDDSRPGIRPPQVQRQPTRSRSSQSHGRPRTPALEGEDDPDEDDVTKMISQPETRPISQEQLVAEVKGIYAGLVMVESKCIEVDNAQSSLKNDAQPLNNEQWQALVSLYRTLLHEHHDFFLASQHPSASEPLRRLASKYAMPARMWRHGIHSFLELLRHRLPASLEHIQTFIYLAYSMMALLYEAVPAYEDTWIECLGDLSRYRMAIEDDDLRDREVWTAVSKHWYSKASDRSPTTGRLYHHLAILARPNAVEQLFYYTKSLCAPSPFNSARESPLSLFEPVAHDGAFKRLRDSFRRTIEEPGRWSEEAGWKMLGRTSSTLTTHWNRLAGLAGRLEKHDEMFKRSLEYTNMIAVAAQESASIMEKLAVKMHQIAERTKRQTVSMHVITILSLIYLPGKFISTLLSSGQNQWLSRPLPDAILGYGERSHLPTGSGLDSLHSSPTIYESSLLSLSSLPYSFLRRKRPLSGRGTKIRMAFLAYSVFATGAYALSPPSCNTQCGAWIGAGMATATNYFAVELSPPANSTNWMETVAVAVAFVLAIASVGMFGSALNNPATPGRGQQNLYYLLTAMFAVVCVLAVAAIQSSAAHPVISYTPTLIDLPAAVLFLLWNNIRSSAEGPAPQAASQTEP